MRGKFNFTRVDCWTLQSSHGKYWLDFYWMSLNECIDLKKKNKKNFLNIWCVCLEFFCIHNYKDWCIYLVGGHLWNLVPILNREESYTYAKSYLN